MVINVRTPAFSCHYYNQIRYTKSRLWWLLSVSVLLHSFFLYAPSDTLHVMYINTRFNRVVLIIKMKSIWIINATNVMSIQANVFISNNKNVLPNTCNFAKKVTSYIECTQWAYNEPQVFLFLFYISSNFDYPSPRYVFKMHFRACAIIIYTFHGYSFRFDKFQAQCSYKIVLIERK